MKPTLEYCIDHLFETEGIDVSVDHVKASYHPKEKILVVFGSDDIWDWITSFDLLPKKGFHGGYYKAATKLLHKLQFLGIKPELAVGYSIGGAILGIMAPDLKETITVGAPRYLYNDVERGGRVCHIEIFEDIITTFPFWAAKDGKITIYESGEWNPVKAHDLETYVEYICGHNEDNKGQD